MHHCTCVDLTAVTAVSIKTVYLIVLTFADAKMEDFD